MCSLPSGTTQRTQPLKIAAESRAGCQCGAYNPAMLRRIPIILCALFGVLMLVGGCSTPNYSTTTAEQCSDGKVSGDETDVDCGGSCMPCAINKACKVDADCASATCIDNKCYDPSCRDGKQDNDESDTDCGGGTCPACKDSYKCASSADCVDGNPCIAGVCFSAGCNNGKQDGDETGIDCGGDQCPACDALQGCNQSSDCKTGNSCFDNLSRAVIDVAATTDCGDAGACAHKGTCYSDSCKNGNLDDPETDIDCGGGACPGCATFKKCLQNTDCLNGDACIGGTCYIASCLDNKLDANETDKDCGGADCPACGKGKTCKSSNDCEANTPCTNGACGDPKCFNKVQDPGETDVDCGGTCAPCDLNKKCASFADCASQNCNTGLCSPATCSDSVKNQGESAVDCGDDANLCKRCDPGATCTKDSNCASNHCVGGVCAAATCSDGVLNQNETDIDCGGPCGPCADNNNCLQSSDCKDKVCKGGTCNSPSCSDGIQNGQETGKDCGGPCAAAPTSQLCPNGQGCSNNADCAFGNCADSTCQPPVCANRVQDATETDVDCGGVCAPCGDGLGCVKASDCVDKVCDHTHAPPSPNPSPGTCAASTCSDQVQNGNETDVDCGGVTCIKRCGTGNRCLSDSDCVSKVCDRTGLCAAPTCCDGVQNGNETGPDCGGDCAMQTVSCGSAPSGGLCGAGKGCNVDGDCASNNCCTAASCLATINTCVAANCSDGKKNQGETGVDCGGDPKTTGCADRCGTSQGCNDKSDCISGVCTGSSCQAPTCKDGVMNGNEGGPDCGAACQPNLCSNTTTCLCDANVTCNGPGDCQSGVCSKDASGNYTTCAAATCTDGVKNGTESCAADTGGGCSKKCSEGSACNVAADCDPSVANIDCISGICSVPSCKDTAIDGLETDLNCGGGQCAPCANGKTCKVAADCTSSVCADDGTGIKRCATPTCGDSTINEGESGVDCGGTSPCNKCGTGLGCTANSDCLSGVCDPSTNKCAAPTCSDGVQNEQETYVDCGGPNCQGANACPDSRPCQVSTDCQNQWCDTRSSPATCKTPSCTDQVKNGSESDVDCGGTCPTKCADGQACNKATDCANGWCNSGKCATPSCTDSIQNGTETGKDCGGNCAASCATSYDSNCKQCSDNSGCTGASDCKSLNCASNVCAAPSGTTAAACVGKVLDVTGCDKCASTTGIDPVKCHNVLWCIYANNCSNPGTVNTSGIVTYANCTDGGVNGPCSVNKLSGYGSTTINTAVKAFRCACP